MSHLYRAPTWHPRPPARVVPSAPAAATTWDIAPTAAVGITGTVGVSGDVAYTIVWDFAAPTELAIAGALGVSGDIGFLVAWDVAPSAAIGISGTMGIAGDFAGASSWDIAQSGSLGITGALSISGAIAFSTWDGTDSGALAARRAARRRTLRAASSRDINYMFRRIEPADEKSPVYREQVPGLTLWATLTGEFRGGWWTGSRAFVVFGHTLYELFDNATSTALGTLNTSTGVVDFAQGLFQLVMVDGSAGGGYVLTLATNAFAQITDPDFYGSKRVDFMDGRWYFVRPDTQQFYWNDTIDVATDFDALGFKSAESKPDNIVSMLIDHRELIAFGELSTEPFLPIPSGDEILQRNNGGVTETGCAATHTAQKFDNTYAWVSQDKNGRGIVVRAGGQTGSQPQRMSTHDVEEALSNSTDLSGAWAWTYQEDGQTFYVLNAPGLSTSWVFDASVNRWHERAELVNGQLQPWRARGHLYAFGLHLVGDDDGKLYELDPYEYTYAGDVMYREVTSPHGTAPSLRWIEFARLRLNVSLGQTSSGTDPQIEMRYSDDGGETWSIWIARSLGRIGEFDEPPVWHRIGRAKDRVWQFRVTDDCKASIIGMDVEAKEGSV